MSYLDQLTDDEVKYICSEIPIPEVVNYFKQYPKSFAKVMPGFRATSLRSQEEVGVLLFRCRNHPFISSFIENHIGRWLNEIQSYMSQVMDNGANRDHALLQTLPICYFAGNIVLFFKLIREQHSEEYTTLLSEAVQIIKETDAKRDKSETELKIKSSDMKKLQTEFKVMQMNLESAGNTLSERNTEIKELKCTIIELEKLKTTVQTGDKEISALRIEIQEKEKYIEQLKLELSEAKDNHQLLEEKIWAELEEQLAATVAIIKETRKPLRPKDMEEFKDYLGYNLASIGVSSDSEYFYLLKEHLCCILFQGMPIVINRGVGVSLMKCVANALAGTSHVSTLTFVSDISEQIIDEFLSGDDRIVCLDNFIGNYNETILLTLCDKHKDSIIFFTVAYDRTIYFIPDEFFRYCNYLNLNRIKELSANVDLTEAPYTVEMVVDEVKNVTSDMMYSPLLRIMLKEFDFSQSLIEHKCSLINSEQDLCCLLAFDIMPYCVDVLQAAPYNVSERLVKYAGNTGRCPYRNLLRRWFGDK